MLTGRPLSEALDTLVKAAQSTAALWPEFIVDHRFAWRERLAVVHVTWLDGGTTFLDAAVPVFELVDVTLEDALLEVHRLRDPAFPNPRETHGTGARVQSFIGIVPTGTREIPDPATHPERTRRFSVSVRDTTLRGVLDAIVLAHGRSWWQVQYSSTTGEYSGAAIGFGPFDGPSIFHTALVGQRGT